MKLDDSEILWRKIDTTRLESKQVFIRHVNLGAKELTITLYAGVINTPLASVKLNVNIMSESKDVVISALKKFGLDDVSLRCEFHHNLINPLSANDVYTCDDTVITSDSCNSIHSENLEKNLTFFV